MKNISEQTFAALSALVSNPEAVEQLPSSTRQALVQVPRETMARLAKEGNTLTLNEKKEQAFLQSYRASLKIRDLLRGWGDYGSKDGESHFAHLLHHVCDVAKNSAHTMCVGTNTDMATRFGVLAGLVEDMRLQITAFQVREGIDLGVMRKLNLLSEALKAGKPQPILEAAVCLKAFMGGIEQSNDIMLGPVGKLNG